MLTLDLNTPDFPDPGATVSAPKHTTKAKKQQDRMLSNRQAAHNSRQRKKTHIETLEAAVKKLKETNQELLEQIRSATLENNILKANINFT